MNIKELEQELCKKLAEVDRCIRNAKEAIGRMTPEQQMIIGYLTEHPEVASAIQDLNQILAREKAARGLEGYEPKESLIKDEKIRKAVRAWAEANEIVSAYISMNEARNWMACGKDIDRNKFFIEFFNSPVPTEQEDKRYTIDELCGEEEE